MEDGLGTLNENKVSLEEGADSLTLGSAELNNGFSEVLSGVKSLKEGVEKFDREGIQELEKLAGQELRNVVQRLRVLRETDGTWNRFSGDSDKDVSLKIVLETEGI